MTTDALTLRQLLDTHPGSIELACMLADELQACGAPEGVVALARLDRVPEQFAPLLWFWHAPDTIDGRLPKVPRAILPAPWFDAVCRVQVARARRNPHDQSRCASAGPTREEAEQAAAAAFLRLPEHLRAAYLRGEWE